jgi:hypothetical protein
MITQTIGNLRSRSLQQLQQVSNSYLSNPINNYRLEFKNHRPRINFASNRKDNLCAHFYNKYILMDFEYLHIHFPQKQNRTFSFIKKSETLQVLYVGAYPALVLEAKISNLSGLLTYREVFLKEILPLADPVLNKFKRLFIRHLGFSCSKDGNKTVLAGNKFPSKEHLHMYNDSPVSSALIGTVVY